LKNAILEENELTHKNISKIKKSIENAKHIEKEFRAIRPFCKKYFECKNKLQHYEKKLEKIRNKMDGKQKIKG